MDIQPDETLVNVLSFLDQSSIVRISRVNKRFYSLAFEDSLWRKKIYVWPSLIAPSAHPLYEKTTKFDMQGEIETKLPIYIKLHTLGKKIINLPDSIGLCGVCEQATSRKWCFFCAEYTCERCADLVGEEEYYLCKKCIKQKVIVCQQCSNVSMYSEQCAGCAHEFCINCLSTDREICVDCGGVHPDCFEERAADIPRYCAKCAERCTDCAAQILNVEHVPYKSLFRICCNCSRHYCSICIDNHNNF